MRLTIKAKDLNKLAQRLEKNADQAKKVLTATGSDMKTRVPGWVSTEVTGVYNIKKQEVTPQKAKAGARPKKTVGHIRVQGTTINSVEITYTGRLLTPIHFGMKPKALPAAARGRRKRRPITAEIKKGQRKSLGPQVFLGSNKGGGYIPFKRTGAKAYPIQSIKTLSLPQMIDNPNVRENISTKINSELQKRLEHNIRRYLK